MGGKWVKNGQKMVQKCFKIPYFTFSEPKRNRFFPLFFDVLDRFLGRPRPKMARNRPSSGLRGALGRPGFGENFQKVVGMTPKTPKSVYKSVPDLPGASRGHGKAKPSKTPKIALFRPFSDPVRTRSGPQHFLSPGRAGPKNRPRIIFI